MKASHQCGVHAVPCLTPSEAAYLRRDADATAKKLGGWRPRAVGFITDDVLVSTLSPTSKRLIKRKTSNKCLTIH